MTLQDLIEHVYQLADEEGEPDEITKWLNDALAHVNVELGAMFPFFSLNSPDDEHPITQTWQHLVLIPFAVGRIKQKDASQFEYSDAYGEFRSNLQKMKQKYTVPAEYVDESMTKDSYSADETTNPYNWQGW